MSVTVRVLGEPSGVSPITNGSTEPKSTSMGLLLLIVQVDGLKLSELRANTLTNVLYPLTNVEDKYTAMSNSTIAILSPDLILTYCPGALEIFKYGRPDTLT